MPEFVGDDAAQNDGDLELVAIPLGTPQRVVIVDGGENRNDCKTKNSILKLVLGSLREHAQHDIGSPKRLETRILLHMDAVVMFHRAICPNHLQTGLAEDSASFAFGLRYDHRRSLCVVVHANPEHWTWVCHASENGI